MKNKTKLFTIKSLIYPHKVSRNHENPLNGPFLLIFWDKMQFFIMFHTFPHSVLYIKIFVRTFYNFLWGSQGRIQPYTPLKMAKCGFFNQNMAYYLVEFDDFWSNIGLFFTQCLSYYSMLIPIWLLNVTCIIILSINLWKCWKTWDIGKKSLCSMNFYWFYIINYTFFCAKWPFFHFLWLKMLNIVYLGHITIENYIWTFINCRRHLMLHAIT